MKEVFCTKTGVKKRTVGKRTRDRESEHSNEVLHHVLFSHRDVLRLSHAIFLQISRTTINSLPITMERKLTKRKEK